MKDKYKLKKKIKDTNELLDSINTKNIPSKYQEVYDSIHNELKLLTKELTSVKRYEYAHILKKEDEIRKYHNKNRQEYLGDKCVLCDSYKNLHLHHEVYEKDIKPITLCSRCHMKLHQWTRNLIPKWHQ